MREEVDSILNQMMVLILIKQEMFLNMEKKEVQQPIYLVLVLKVVLI
jgi:hypothetical protein